MAQTPPHEAAEVLDDLLRAWRQITPDSTLSRTAAYSLGALYRTGPMRLTALATDQAVSQPAMTGLVRRLEKQGLVERSSDPGDGRVVFVALTQRGRDELVKRQDFYVREIESRLAKLDDVELSQLIAALPALRHITVKEN